MITWPIAHNVRSAGWSLGVKGCTECHSEGGLIFASTVTPVGPAPGVAETTTMAALRGMNPNQLLVWNQLFRWREFFKYVIAGSLASVVVSIFLGVGNLASRLGEQSIRSAATAEGPASWTDVLMLIGLTLVVVSLAVTAAPALNNGHLNGMLLLMHMVASGALVIILPLFAFSGLGAYVRSIASRPTQRLGFWIVVSTGLLTIATIFLCMLPIPSTSAMETLIRWHGYTGFAMLIAMIALCLSVLRYRKKTGTRAV